MDGPRSPARVRQEGSVDEHAWSSPQSAQVPDTDEATAGLWGTAVTGYLRATDFAFELPDDAVVQGITVTWSRSARDGEVVDHAVRLVRDFLVRPGDRSRSEPWPTLETLSDHGGATDLWDDAWLLEDINSPGFGAALSGRYVGGAGNDSARVGHVLVTVSYFDPTSGLTQEQVRAPNALDNHFSLSTIPWQDAADIFQQDGLHAFAQADGTHATTARLVAEDFGFGLPDDAVVNGVTVDYRRVAESPEPITDVAVRLVVNGNLAPGNHAGATWGPFYQLDAFGGPDDTWGAALTPALVNRGVFGTALIVDVSADDNARLRVDHVQATVRYTQYPSIASRTASTVLDLGADAFPWTNETALLAPDDVVATVQVGSGQRSDRLRISGWNLGVPVGVVVRGIVVHLEGVSGFGTLEAQLRAPDGVLSDVMASSIFDAAGGMVRTVGSAEELWGHAWTAAELNSDLFAVEFQVVQQFVASEVRADNLAVVVYLESTCPP